MIFTIKVLHMLPRNLGIRAECTYKYGSIVHYETMRMINDLM